METDRSKRDIEDQRLKEAGGPAKPTNPDSTGTPSEGPSFFLTALPFFILAHAALWGAPHCVTETLRATLWHHVRHWTAPYFFMKRGRWSCRQVSRTLLGLVQRRLGLDGPLILAIDDTLVRRWGRQFDGLGLYPDPTDKKTSHGNADNAYGDKDRRSPAIGQPAGR